MPVYDYLCADCGPFTDMRPMAECDLPRGCPDCGSEAPRAFLNAPQITSKSTSKRGTNAFYPSTGASHASGCGCCSTGMSYRKKAKTSAGGAKGFTS
jgi:putative FmdB family regulatory protein